MKKIVLPLAFLLSLFECKSNDDPTIMIPSIDGTTFVRVGYVVETPMDLNGDGVYTHDFLSESDVCTEGLPIMFSPGESVFNPLFNFIAMSVREENGVLIQQETCGGNVVGNRPRYEQVNDQVFLKYGDEIFLTGELSPDGNELKFFISPQQFGEYNFQGFEILNEDGTVTDYQGGAKIIYLKQ